MLLCSAEPCDVTGPHMTSTGSLQGVAFAHLVCKLCHLNITGLTCYLQRLVLCSSGAAVLRLPDVCRMMRRLHMHDRLWPIPGMSLCIAI